LAVVAVLVAGNLTILLAHGYAYATGSVDAPTEISGLHNLRVVDERVWRGRAPDAAGYQGLADAGVTTVVDLRAETDLDIPDPLLAEIGIERHALPIRDGQTPTPAEVTRFREIVEDADGLVYVHCGAGVGRTGAVAAAYLVQTGQIGRADALGRNLAIGPPSLEQIWYVVDLDDDSGQPPAPVKWASRFFDAPRRIWTVARL
jgi:protein-tyrosine phosphatase